LRTTAIPRKGVLHDAIMAEQAGTPAAAIMTDRFAASALIMAETLGLPGYPFALIPHPISSDGEVELRAKAQAAVEQCVKILTRR